MNNQNKFSTAAIAKLAMMTAVSMVLLLLVRIPFPPAPFLVYDPADVPIYITAFAFGPAAGLIVTLVVCLIQAFMLGGDGLYGFLMHFVATGIVAVVIGLMYKNCKTKESCAGSRCRSYLSDSSHVRDESHRDTCIYGCSKGSRSGNAAYSYYPVQSAQGRHQLDPHIHSVQEGQRFPARQQCCQGTGGSKIIHEGNNQGNIYD